MQDFEKPGAFYLGRAYDLAMGQVLPAPVLYDSQDLTTHAVCVGMTGSGKTGLCLSLLEEAALDGIPAIAIDPKGDLGNLLLAFPELRPSDFRPWVDESVASRKGVTPDQLAEQTAAMWCNGLSQWGEDGERIGRFTKAVDRAIYTPGSSAGLPLTVLKSFKAPPQAVLDDGDAFGDRIQSAASGLLALLGIEADPVKSREHILLSKVLENAWRGGRDLDLHGLIHEVQDPPFKMIGAVPLESFFPANARLELGMRLNNLLASPSFASWLEGEPLDVQRLLYTAEGRPRLSILSIAHLGDAERMFFVTLLLNEVITWMRSQPGTGSLRAILYMDEVFGFFPPTANPPAKRPMLTLLKQARAYGVGCVLATQNPVDLDYKGLSNAGTWFLGRLQTERDKRRVIEGLEGASAEAGGRFDRNQMEATLAALDSRVFLMNNVHASAPTVFHTRWAMSYLAGPLTRSQIASLMADRKAAQPKQQPAERGDASLPEDHAPRSRAANRQAAGAVRPVLSADIVQRFWPTDGDAPPRAGHRLTYRPALLGAGRLHFVKAADDVDAWREFAALQPVHGELPTPTWSSVMMMEQKPTLTEQPQAGASFDDLPGELAHAKNYRRWDDDLKAQVYQTERLRLWENKEFGVRSLPNETEDQFRSRLSPLVVKQLEREVSDAATKAAEHRWWLASFLFKAAGRAAEVLITGLFGRRSRKQVVTSTLWGQAMRDRQRYAEAKAVLREKKALLARLKQPHDDNLPSTDRLAPPPPYALQLETIEISPRKSDIAVDEVLLVWLPWWVSAEGESQPAY